MPSESTILNIGQIMEYLPHRYPFLLIDRVIEMERAKRIVAIKNVTINEPFFSGHFPGYPIMPGVLVVEAMAQAGCILLLAEVQDREKKLVVFTGIESAKFRRPITPGDQLRIEVEVLSFRPRAGRMEGKAYVDGKLACEATLTCAVVPRQARGQVPEVAGPEAPGPEVAGPEVAGPEVAGPEVAGPEVAGPEAPARLAPSIVAPSVAPPPGAGSAE